MVFSGGFDWVYDFGFYFGIWLFNVDFLMFSFEFEVDIYGGYGFEWLEIVFDVGVVYFYYVNVNEVLGVNEIDYWEFLFFVSKDFGFVSILLGMIFFFDYFGELGFFFYLVFSVGVVMFGVEWLILDGSVGYSFIDDNVIFGMDDYFDYGVFVSVFVEDFVILSVGYFGIDLDIVDCFGGNDCVCDGWVIGFVLFFM